MNLPSAQQRRAYWLKTLHKWHWMSAALSLVGLLVFAATGLTLNNAAWIEASPEVTSKTLTLPDAQLRQLQALHRDDNDNAPLPPAIEAWLDQELDIRIGGRSAEYSAEEVYLSLPGPGADAWMALDLTTGDIEYERSDRGWIAYFNDLHKGRHTGTAWSWFIDVLAIACLIFALTGLFLMKLHAKNRPASWPLTGLGLVIPLVLMLLFIH